MSISKAISAFLKLTNGGQAKVLNDLGVKTDSQEVLVQERRTELLKEVMDKHVLSDFYRVLCPREDGNVILTTLAEIYVLKQEKWGTGRDSYPYDADYCCYENVPLALAALNETKALKNPSIYGRRVELLADGRVRNQDFVIYKGGVWENPDYDPRNADPEYKVYIALKKKFESQENQ